MSLEARTRESSTVVPAHETHGNASRSHLGEKRVIEPVVRASGSAESINDLTIAKTNLAALENGPLLVAERSPLIVPGLAVVEKEKPLAIIQGEKSKQILVPEGSTERLSEGQVQTKEGKFRVINARDGIKEISSVLEPGEEIGDGVMIPLREALGKDDLSQQVKRGRASRAARKLIKPVIKAATLAAVFLGAKAGAGNYEKDINQEALNQMKNRTTLEQVVDVARNTASIDQAEADGGGDFADVPSSHPYSEAINYLANKVNPKTGDNIISGYDDGTFKPGKEVARQHFAKMIVNSLGLSVPEGNTAFKDVPETGSDTKYPDDFVRVAVENGIIKGYGDGTFKPYNNINRAQEVTMIIRALQKFSPGVLRTPPGDYHSPFGDFDSTHQENMDIFYYNGLNKGIVGWNANAWANMTRGETAQALYNFLKLKEQPPVERKLQKLNITLAELQGYGHPDIVTVTGSVSTATKNKFASYNTGYAPTFEGSTNDPNDMNAILLNNRMVKFGPGAVPLDGDGFTKDADGQLAGTTGEVVGFATVNGLDYIVLKSRSSGEKWALSLCPDTTKQEASTVVTGDLRKSDLITGEKQGGWLGDMLKGQDVYTYMSKFYATGDTATIGVAFDINAQAMKDKNGKYAGKKFINYRQASFDQFVSSMY